MKSYKINMTTPGVQKTKAQRKKTKHSKTKQSIEHAEHNRNEFKKEKTLVRKKKHS